METPPKDKKEGPRVITKYSVFMKTLKSELMTMFKGHITPPKTATSRAAQSEGKRAGKRKRAAEVPAPEETAPAAVSNDILEKKVASVVENLLTPEEYNSILSFIGDNNPSKPMKVHKAPNAFLESTSCDDVLENYRCS